MQIIASCMSDTPIVYIAMFVIGAICVFCAWYFEK